MRDELNESRKATIRRTVRARRRAMSQADHDAATARLTPLLTSLTEGLGARVIACYSAMTGEPNTGPFIDWAVSQGLEVLLPVSLAGSQLDWARYEGTGDLRNGRHGITEPAGARLGVAAPTRADLVLVPACAVDASGTRLGWGMGYYDRCLAMLPPRIPVYAVVFDDDRHPGLPRDPHDIPVTGAVSPARVTTVLSGTG